ncbi:MAG: S26 family signal peptidase [Planctomycetes bacterium]|nr:S26 family signal peptidase [Planctomycetota bacterium]
MSDSATPSPTRSTAVDTIQGLIVAFTLAMAFRGFILEGFVIPTGSMGPTLLGDHVRVRSDATGYAYTVDGGSVFDNGAPPTARAPMIDPMVTRQFPMGEMELGRLRQQVVGGDRVLVLKYVPWIFEPQRWDVAVFKNPPDPIGISQNYIKRMVGLPSESLVLVDGDVFTGAPDAAPDALRIQRKTEMAQRAVWQPVWRNDWAPIELKKLESNWKHAWPGPAFLPSGEKKSAWTAGDTRIWRWPDSAATQLEWSSENFPVSDWNAYNVWRRSFEFPMSDIRLSAALEFDQPEKAAANVTLNTRGLRIEAAVDNAAKSIEISVKTNGSATEPPRVLAQQKSALATADRHLDLEFWHVDQAVWLFVNGTKIACLPYEFAASGTTPEMRLVASGIDPAHYRNDPVAAKPAPMQSLSMNFSGSPVTIRNMELDRDLYYQPGILLPGNQTAVNGSIIMGKAYATDIDDPARLGPDDYLMLGDNSPASRDGRFWGRPHPILQRVIGFEKPFLVPREMIVGKAWCVYFPATYPLAGGLDMQDPAAKSPNIVPNFGSMRFIR